MTYRRRSRPPKMFVERGKILGCSSRSLSIRNTSSTVLGQTGHDRLVVSEVSGEVDDDNSRIRSMEFQRIFQAVVWGAFVDQISSISSVILLAASSSARGTLRCRVLNDTVVTIEIFISYSSIFRGWLAASDAPVPAPRRSDPMAVTLRGLLLCKQETAYSAFVQLYFCMIFSRGPTAFRKT